MKRNKIAFLLILIFVVSLAACNGSKKDTGKQLSSSTTAGDTGTQGQDEVSSEKTAAAEEKTDFVFPSSDIRPYSVMIDNEGSRPLPQGGLDKAQVIYEIIVEGGATRLMPIFWGTAPEMIGPVRSSRHYFLDYAMEHDAIYIHFGGSPMAYKDIKAWKINDIDGVTGRDGGIFHDITNDKKNWQDSYTSMDKIVKQVEKLKYRTSKKKDPVFNYYDKDTELSGGQPAAKIEIKYNSQYVCGYSYDEASKLFLRTRQGKPQMERTSGKQLTAKNIIIQKVKNSLIKGDKAGRQELADVGSGTGWFVSCGKVIEIKWSKASRSAQTKYTDNQGDNIILNPGQTWVQIVSPTSKVTFE